MNNLIIRALPRITKRINVVFHYNGSLPEEPELPPGLQWGQANSILIDRVFSEDKSRRNALQKLLKMGAHGIIIHDGQQWAAHGFLSPPGVCLPEHLPKKVVRELWWLFYMHTHPEWRQKGLQKACIKLSIRTIYELCGKFDNIMADTGIDNFFSQNGFKRTGFEPAGVLQTLELRLPKIGSYLLSANWDRSKSHWGVAKV